MLALEVEQFSAEGSIARFYYPTGAERTSAEYHVALFTHDSKQVVITGNLYSLEEKETIIVNGEWINNSKYGRQVKVKSWERPMPSTEEQAIIFLSSGLVKGVGPATAKKIVRKLGADAVKIIMEKGKIALEGIKGLRYVDRIIESIRSTYEVQRVVSQLLPMGISVNTAVRAHKKFGGGHSGIG